jgi:vitamin B12 transporter
MRGAAQRHCPAGREGTGTEATIRESGYRRKPHFNDPPRSKEGIAMFRITVLRALCAVAFVVPIATGIAAAAPTPSPSPSASPLVEIAHVITSDRSNESAARAARTTYVVTAADIARNGDRTVADALANLPGVNVTSYGGFGAQAIVGIRGSSSAQVLVLVDGQPVAGSQIGDVNLEQLPVTGVDRIEVVEGGGSTLYGAGSIGGVINIITSMQQTPNTATVATGSYGEQTYQFHTPYFSFQRTYATNNYAVTGAPNRQNAQAGLTAGSVAYSQRAGAFDFSFTGDLSNALVGVPGELDFFSPTSEQNTVNRDLRLTTELKGARSTASLTLGDSSQDLAYTCNTPVDDDCPNAFFPTPPPGQLTNPPYSELLYDQHWMASLRNVVGDNRQRLVYGIDLSRGIARVDPGTGSIQPSAANNPVVDPYAQTAAYIQQQWFASNGNGLYAGLRGERDGGLGGAYSPSLGGILHLSQAVEFKLNAATAFRAPTAEDLYFPGFSNPNLVAERARVGDATFVVPGLGGGVSLGWFTTSGTNLIVSTEANNFIPENVGHASIQGVILDAKTAPMHGYVASLNLTNVYRAQDLDNNSRLPGRGPVFAATVGLRYIPLPTSRFDGFGISLDSQGAQEAADPFLGAQYAQYQPSSYSILNAYAGYRVAPKLALTVRGFNLGNDRYAIFAGYPMPGRGFAVELRAR